MGYDHVGDAYNGTNVPIPDADPIDCGGHRTYVKGLVVALSIILLTFALIHLGTSLESSERTLTL
jgi:hypothetical protein